jgi:hypothetical protein
MGLVMRRIVSLLKSPHDGGEFLMQRIAIFNFNETRGDPRVRRTSTALRAAGHEVRVFEMAGPNLPLEEEILAGVRVRRVSEQAYDDSAMGEVANEAPDFAALLR